jgi:hypothetical protein
MKALGVGWTVQDAMYNTGADILKRRVDGEDRPPATVVTGNKIGVPIGAGTDATAFRRTTRSPFCNGSLTGRTRVGRPSAPLRRPRVAATHSGSTHLEVRGSHTTRACEVPSKLASWRISQCSRRTT